MSTEGQDHPLTSKVLNPHFFSMSQLPAFGKNWLDHFIPDDDMQQLFVTSEVARNIIMLQCLYFVKVYRDLLKYKLSYARNRAKEADPKNSELQYDEDVDYDLVDLKIGIIGCGQVGTMILTKLLEAIPHFRGIKIFVSTRQPDLLNEFKEEFKIEAEFNNEKIAEMCDIIFLCCLPFQGDIVLREIRGILHDRNVEATKDKALNRPVLISTLAAVGIPKLKLMATEETIILRTFVNIANLKSKINLTASKPSLALPNVQNIEGNESDNESNKEESKIEEPKLGKDTADKEKLHESSNAQFTGNEPYFMISQASANLIRNLDELFNIFDAFQNTFYTGEAQESLEDKKEEVDEDRAIYEESILITVLGENYSDFIDPNTGEWTNETEILIHFNKLFFEEMEGMLKNIK
ncbi:unnamed protein product [Moneuplotes crassus]|uniref:Pyrroline-5-carboxylate reductase catalytic N-terminal domain-containing protein n=1 Tax=Euplotes crassus TaxID=5936 RepID=A0AAD1XFX5_EUPCR|nr:unnamed protein product [Moneuplotes crassus]